MTTKDLERLYDYNYWANRKVCAVLSQMPPEHFTQTTPGSYGSIRNTMVHMLSAEWGWLDRCGGPPRGPALKADNYPTLDSLTSECTKVEGYVRGFLAGLSDPDLARVIEYSNPKGEKRSGVLSELLQHAANHAVHHRGQVALLIRSLGHTPGNFDLLFYDAEKRSAPAL